MNATELREKTPAELEGLLLEFLREQFSLRMQRGSGNLSRNHQLKAVRRNIARVKTILTELQGIEK